MADINVQQRTTTEEPKGSYTTGELIFWIVGVLAIPMVPILMVHFLTPFSGF